MLTGVTGKILVSSVKQVASSKHLMPLALLSQHNSYATPELFKVGR